MVFSHWITIALLVLAFIQQAGVTGQSDVVDEDGQASPVIGWNDLHILYQLPDGSKWAEHGSLYDSEDLVSCYSGFLTLIW